MLGRLCILLFAAAGVLAILFGAHQGWHGIRSGHWPATEGVVLTVDVEEHRSRGRRQGVRKTSQTYEPKVSYQYAVDGGVYTADRISFAQYYGSKERADAITSRYAVGTTVPVHYNPSEPSDAVLEPGLGSGVFIFFGVGSLFVVVGVGGFLLSLRS